MRVLHVYSGNMYGGVESHLVALARHQDLCPVMESHFALCFEGRLSLELTGAGGRIHLLGNVRVSRPATVWRARRALRTLLQRNSFDVVICHLAWSQAIFGPVVRAARLPLVFWLHGATGGRHWSERWARRTPPDLALCNSHFTASTLPHMFPRVRSEVVYCLTSLPERSAPAADRVATRAELDTPENATVIVQVSRMEASKGHSVHLEALSLISDLPNWVCWQVGGVQRSHEIKYCKDLKSNAAQLGIADRVRFLGQRTDVPNLLAAADVYCQPNTSPEGFGLTFIEALNARLPVVTTAIGGAEEIINHTCGFLVPPNDPRALASTLRELIVNQSLRAKLGAAGPSRAEKICDLAAQMAQIKELLSGVAGDKTSVQHLRASA